MNQPTIQPPAATQYKARIWTGRYRMMAGTPLGYLIDLLPLMPLPGHKAFLQRDPILGALLETERNLHAIERRLARLLTPLLPERGKQAGWMVLNSNGGGGFWFEVMSDFGDAVLVTQDGLRDLYRDVNDDDPLHAELEARVDWVESLAQQIETAKSNMRGARRRSRRRR